MSQLTPVEPLPFQEVEQSSQRLLWTGAAANGALLLALISFAGGAYDQAASLRMVTIPVAIAISGFSFGGVAISLGAARLAQRLVDAVAHRKLVLALDQQAAFKNVLSSPSMDADLAQHIWGERAGDEIKKLILGQLINAQAETEKSQQTFNEAIATLEASNKTGHDLLTKATRWLQASFAAAALAVVTLMAQAWLVTSGPAPTKSLPVAVAEASPVAATETPPRPELPPCRDGTADCDPWERDWREPPPVGTVVPARAK